MTASPSSFLELEAALGHKFRDPTLLRLALTHPSLAHELGGGQTHNQRLEYLGDAVLQLAITAELYYKFPQHGEGPLTQGRAQLVNRGTLAAQGRLLDLGRHLILSRGEETSGGRTRSSTIADAFEAVLGAVFLDAGYEEARNLILRLYQETLVELEVVPSQENPKGELQELLQATSPEPPRYDLLSATGPDHSRLFECAVIHGSEELGRGGGRSKKLAESAAAAAALLRVRERLNTPK